MAKQKPNKTKQLFALRSAVNENARFVAAMSVEIGQLFLKLDMPRFPTGYTLAELPEPQTQSVPSEAAGE